MASHLVQVKDNRLFPCERASFLKDVGKHEGQTVRITIGVKPTLRTERENKYYWGVVVKILSDHIGYEPMEMHEILKAMHNPKTVKMKEDLVVLGRSTANLSIGEFEEYLSRIRRWASIEMGVYIPLPNEEI